MNTVKNFFIIISLSLLTIISNSVYSDVFDDSEYGSYTELSDDFDSSTSSSPMALWGTPEHIKAGDNLKLKYCNIVPILNKDGKTFICDNANELLESTNAHNFELSNGLNVRFGHIIALAGDAFAVASEPITGKLGENINSLINYHVGDEYPMITTQEFSKMRPKFTAAYNTLAEDKSSKDKALKLLELTPEEQNSNLKDIETLGLGYLSLAGNNFDHFSPYSWYAYTTGHIIALNTAAKAGNDLKNDIIDLEEATSKIENAYTIEAYAQHFLTDSFAAGHMRTPRKELQKFTVFAKSGGLLSKFMHDEDSKNGVNVHDQHNSSWRAYGDDNYDIPENTVNVQHMQIVQQESINQIYDVFLNGNSELINKSLLTHIKSYMPIVDDYKDSNNSNKVQTAALFELDADGKLLERNERNNTNSYNWSRLTEGKVLYDFGASVFTNKP